MIKLTSPVIRHADYISSLLGYYDEGRTKGSERSRSIF